MKYYDKVARVTVRAIEIAKSPSAGPGILAVAEELVLAGTGYLAQIDTLHTLETRVNIEDGQALVSIKELARVYDIARAVVLTRLPGETVGQTASTFPTATDLLRFAQALEESLGKLSASEDPKVQALVTEYSQAFAAGSREWAEHVEALQARQKAQQAVEESTRAMGDRLVIFRKLVRATYGSRSKEYHAIKMPRNQVEEEAADGDPAVPAAKEPVKTNAA